jgi:hypothetical protein
VKQKGFAPIFILLIVVIIGAAGYFAYSKGYISINLPKPSGVSITTPTTSPTPDPTANWITYSNNTYHFSFRYPNTWFSTDCNNNNLLLLGSEAVPSCISIGGTVAFEINDKNSESKLGGDLINYELVKQSSDLDNNISKYYLRRVDSGKYDESRTLYTISLDSTYELDAEIFNRTNETVTEQILSTFKFTD